MLLRVRSVPILVNTIHSHSLKWVYVAILSFRPFSSLFFLSITFISIRSCRKRMQELGPFRQQCTSQLFIFFACACFDKRNTSNSFEKLLALSIYVIWSWLTPNILLRFHTMYFALYARIILNNWFQCCAVPLPNIRPNERICFPTLTDNATEWAVNTTRRRYACICLWL